MNIPILFIFFIKDTTAEVFNAIKKAKPSKLYLVSDGPRNDNDKIRIEELRNYVLKNIDWQCDVKKLFREKNLGCRNNVSSAITWFFEQEEMGLILEDDVLPCETAFSFMEEMLYRFQDDKRIGSVTLFNPVSYKTKDMEVSYFFSKYSAIWGWGTWRDRWQKYDVNMKDWPEWKKAKKLKEICNNRFLTEIYWNKLLDFIFYYDKSIWDPQWTFCHFKNDWLVVVPNENQILNIGYNYSDSVNTNFSPPECLRKSFPKLLKFPLRHNSNIKVYDDLDVEIEKHFYEINFLKILGYYTKPLLKNKLLKRFNLYEKIRNVYYKIAR